MKFGTIKEDTENRITLGTNKAEEIFFGLLCITFYVFLLWCFIPHMIHDYDDLGLLDFGVGIFFILFGAFGLFVVSFSLLTKFKVVIDKNIQKVIIKRKMITGQLKSIKMIDFSDIKEIEILHDIQPEYDTWNIHLNIKQGESEWICSDHELKVKEIANKICELTNKSISHYEKDYQK
ncbi:MAG: hypothetical protein C5S48_08465 [Candidatus Methanogaster sp.]|nr:MAG: hypothetical protein C5S48_08465 [ANME-2 cluster archaeon]